MSKSFSTMSTSDQVELTRKLISAVENVKYDEVLELLKLGVNIECKSEEDDNIPLHIAVGGGDIELIELLISNKANVNATGRNDNTALHYALDTEIMRKLIEHNANVNVNDKYRYTTLHFAVMDGDLEMVALLIINKADVNAQNIYGYTPLHFARIKEISKYLIQSKADVNIQNKEGHNPLYCIQEAERIQALSELAGDTD